jgi:pyruvate dehydrogenase E2 component (dihydrolipoamide acetyltransferase)
MATPIFMPRQGQSVESCILVEWLVKAGDAVEEGAAVANIETDKAVFEIESPAAGTIVDLFFEEGDDIPVLTNIAAVGEAGEDVSGLRSDSGATESPVAVTEAPAEVTAAPEPASPVPAAAAGATAVSPRARNLAAELGVAAAGLTGSGPHGRVIERDVRAAAETMPRMSGAAREAAAGGLAAPAAGSGPGGMVLAGDLTAAAPTTPLSVAVPVAAEPEVVPMTGIRKIIAERMHQSLATTAQLTMTMSFDATAILAYRRKVKASGEMMGLPNITINDLIAYATVRMLAKTPVLNAHFLGDRIVRYPSVNLGVAMDTPRGLMVPVVQGAERLSLSALSAAIKPMADAAREGAINPDLLQGGTFTITNMGMMGVETFTPVLNAPEVGILGVGGLQLKPVQGAAGVEHIQAITLSLTVDHQAVDGADGARFLKALTTALENFELTLAG